MSCQFVNHLLLAFAGIGVEVFFLFRGGELLVTRRFGEAGGLQLFDGVYLPGSQSLTLGVLALDRDKLFDVDFLRTSELVVAAVCHLQTRIVGVRQQYLL